MNILAIILLIGLFVVLTPGILLTLPKKGSKLTVAIVHGIVFALLFYLLQTFVLNSYNLYEGYQEGNTTSMPSSTTNPPSVTFSTKQTELNKQIIAAKKKVTAQTKAVQMFSAAKKIRKQLMHN